MTAAESSAIKQNQSHDVVKEAQKFSADFLNLVKDIGVQKSTSIFKHLTGEQSIHLPGMTVTDSKSDSKNAKVSDKTSPKSTSDDGRASIDQVKRLGSDGTIKGEQLDAFFSKRSEPLQKAETPSIASIKEAVSALSGASKDKPYESIHKLPDGQFSIGRYGATDKLIRTWVKEHFGEPIDFSKAKDMVHAGLLPKEFLNKEYRHGFLELMKSLDGSNGKVDPAAVAKFFPPLLQETIATDMVKHFQKDDKGNIGKVALEMVLGKNVSEKEMKEPKASQYVDAGATLYGLAQIRRMIQNCESTNYSTSSNASEESTEKGRKIAEVARQTAEQRNTVGKCQAGVESTMSKVGVEMRKFPDAKSAVGFYATNKRFIEVPADKLQPGDVVVRGAAAGHPYGHTFVYLGNGKEASDHVQHLSRASAYGPSRAFRMVA